MPTTSHHSNSVYNIIFVSEAIIITARVATDTLKVKINKITSSGVDYEYNIAANVLLQFSDYLLHNFFYFHIYNISFHALSKDILQVLGNNVSLCVFAS